jgi:hypothetical protein
VLSAVAATIAATLAGVNLIVSGRRENRRWAREIATEALVQFIDASHATGGRCKEAVELRCNGRDEGQVEDLRRKVDAAVTTQLQNLTRLRLVSTPDVVVSAYELQSAGRDLIRLSFEDATGADDPALTKAMQQLWKARRQMVAAARRSIQVRNATGTGQDRTARSPESV